MNKSIKRLLIPLSLLSLSALSANSYAELVLEPILKTFEHESTVPVAIQNARWHMNDADINTLAFRSMDTLFTTRKVTRSGAVSKLVYGEQMPDISYQFDGKTFTTKDFLDRTYTNAMLIMKDGKIVYENYLNHSTPATQFMAWSMTKSLTSILVGVAVEKGLIKSLDEDITSYLPELKNGAYNGVTIKQVLQMRSGVDYTESYDFASPGIAATNHIQALVKNVVRFVDAAVDIKRAYPPGEFFHYKTIDTAVLGLLIERVSQGGSIASFMTQHLWEPLGAESDGFFIMDGEPGVGREFNGAGYNAVLRDFARVGHMMLNKGKINNKQIISADWVIESTKSMGDESEYLNYGYQWWTLPKTPMYTAIGLQGQFIFVDPSTNTVIVKMSYFPPDPESDDMASGETFSFFKAVSKWQTK